MLFHKTTLEMRKMLSLVCSQGYDVFPPDKWHHFCVSFNARTNKIRFALVKEEFANLEVFTIR